MDCSSDNQPPAGEQQPVHEGESMKRTADSSEEKQSSGFGGPDLEMNDYGPYVERTTVQTRSRLRRTTRFSSISISRWIPWWFKPGADVQRYKQYTHNAEAIINHLKEIITQKEQFVTDAEYQAAERARYCNDYITRREQELRREQDQTVEQLVQTHDHKLAKLTTELDLAHNSHHENLRLMEQKDHDVQKLHLQIMQHKVDISKATRGDNQVADTEIADTVNQLYHKLNDFVVRTFKASNLDIKLLPEEAKQVLQQSVPGYKCMPIESRDSRLKIVLSLISNIMTSHYRAYYYFGLPQASPLTEAKLLVEVMKPETSVQGKRWLEATRQLISIARPDALKEAEAQLIAHMIKTVQDYLDKATAIDWSEKMKEQLRSLFREAFDLFRLLFRQNAVYHFWSPRIYGGEPQRFDPYLMEDVSNSAAEEELHNREVVMVLFEGLYKYGDERGENPKLETLVSRSKVLPMRDPPSKCHEKLSAPREHSS